MQLMSRQVDAVVTDAFPGTQGAPDGGIHTTVIGQDPIRGYLPHGVTFEDFGQVRNARWVVEPLSAASTQWALRVCRERGIEPVVAHVSSDVLFHLRMVEHGLAAAFLPDMVVREAGSDVVPSPWLPSDQQRNILYLVRAGSEHSVALVAVREAIVQAYQQNSNL
jgi:DNA-binding transcriptional LysR family regulator